MPAPTQRRVPRRDPRAAASGLVIVGVVLVLGLVIAAIRPDWQADPIDFRFPARDQPMPPLPTLQQSGQPTPSTLPQQPPPGKPIDLSWLPWLALGLAIAAVAIVIALIAARLLAVRRMQAERPDDELIVVGDIEPDLPTLQRGAATAEERLLAVGNPTDAIIAAWLALEDAAEASGVPRRPAQTPTEFVSDVLGRTGIDTEPVQTLLGLYLRVRFGSHPAGPEDLDQARVCIRALADNWREFAGRPDQATTNGTGGDR